jgi:hypothetical protein
MLDRFSLPCWGVEEGDVADDVTDETVDSILDNIP